LLRHPLPLAPAPSSAPPPTASLNRAYDSASLDKPLDILKSYDWGGDASAFQTIDAAVLAAHTDQAARADLEKRLSSLLGEGTSRAAKEYVCRKLSLIGTAASVPSLAALLPEQEHSHMARFALERIDAAEAAEALRKALGSVTGDLKIGMISSLAGRGDAASVPLIAALLAAAAGGTDQAVAAAIIDARLACAEWLLRQGKRPESMAIYKSLADAAAKGTTPTAKSTRLAAARGILACLDTTTTS
jgi:hypothetical protein